MKINFEKGNQKLDFLVKFQKSINIFYCKRANEKVFFLFELLKIIFKKINKKIVF